MSTLHRLFTAFVLLVSVAAPTQAVLTVANTNANSDTAFDGTASATDLVNSGQPTFSSATTTRTPTFGFPGINNGVAATDVNHSAFYRNTETPASVTFDLNTAVNVNGYTIQSLNTIAGWTGVNVTQANQKYEVLVSQVGDPTFRLLGTVTNAPFAASSTAGASTRSIVTDTTGTLATNVDRVRLNLIYPGLVGNNSTLGTVYREVDVIGVATAAALAPRTNLISNGSFETPIVSGFQLFTTGSPFDANWAINGETTLVRGQFGTIASDGAQWLSLESFGSAAFPNNDATISQTITTTPGVAYDLTFDYTVLGSDSVNTPWQLDFNFGAGVQSLLIDNTAQLTIGAWQNHTVRFTATAATTTISFAGIAKVDGFFGPAIDNVGVFQVNAAVPEPASLSLTGIAVLALAGRRRRTA